MSGFTTSATETKETKAIRLGGRHCCGDVWWRTSQTGTSVKMVNYGPKLTKLSLIYLPSPPPRALISLPLPLRVSQSL